MEALADHLLLYVQRGLSNQVVTSLIEVGMTKGLHRTLFWGLKRSGSASSHQSQTKQKWSLGLLAEGPALPQLNSATQVASTEGKHTSVRVGLTLPPLQATAGATLAPINTSGTLSSRAGFTLRTLRTDCVSSSPQMLTCKRGAQAEGLIRECLKCHRKKDAEFTEAQTDVLTQG